MGGEHLIHVRYNAKERKIGVARIARTGSPLCFGRGLRARQVGTLSGKEMSRCRIQNDSKALVVRLIF